jgi:hypothetical protein
MQNMALLVKDTVSRITKGARTPEEMHRRSLNAPASYAYGRSASTARSRARAQGRRGSFSHYQPTRSPHGAPGWQPFPPPPEEPSPVNTGSTEQGWEL